MRRSHESHEHPERPLVHRGGEPARPPRAPGHGVGADPTARQAGLPPPPQRRVAGVHRRCRRRPMGDPEMSKPNAETETVEEVLEDLRREEVEPSGPYSAFAIAVCKIERDARLSELTPEEITSLVEAIRGALENQSRE